MIDFGANISALRAEIRARRGRSMLPPPIMTVDVWADTYRRMSRAASSTGGRFRTSTVEVARGPMLAVTERGVRKISILCATQLMKTTILENVLAYFIHLDPAPIMLLQPKEDFAEAFVKERVTPMVQSTPELLKAFGGKSAFKSRSSDNTLAFKRFTGGFLAVSSAGSPTNLAMRAIRILLRDEVDKYAITKEGDPNFLAAERLETFPMNSLDIGVCSPTVKGSSQIEREWHMSDRRLAYVACPQCQHEDHLQWSSVEWDKDEGGRGLADTARIICQGCGYPWSETDRRKVLTTKGAIHWRQTRPFSCCGETQHPDVERQWNAAGHAVCKTCHTPGVSNTHAGFRASALYSPWSTLAKTVKKWLDCQGSRDLIKAFVNTRLAETFADELEEAFNVDPEALSARAEPPWSLIPAAVKVLVMGVDGQGDRLEGEMVGYGDGRETWSLDYHVLPGDPSQSAVWENLDDILTKPYLTEDGRTLYIQACCIDTGGHNMDSVVSFCAPRVSRRVWAIKGSSDVGGRRSELWSAKVQTVKRGVKIYPVGTLSGKDRVEAALKVVVPGPGYMHFPANRHASWYEQLTAEKRVIFTKNGRKASTWMLKVKGGRNEALDCRVYADAAFEGLTKGKFKTGITAPTAVIPDRTAASAAAIPRQARAAKPKRKSSFWG